MNKYALWLHEIKDIGRQKIALFAGEGINAQSLWEMPQEEIWKVCGILFTGKGQAEKIAGMLGRAHARTPEQAEEELQRRELGFVSVEDKEYPERLRSIPDAPYGLYYKGRLPSDRKPCVAVIGARLCSSYGLRQAERFSSALAAAGVQVVSGLARGIDGAAQYAAAQLGCSFAVMGCGADICYPKENQRIYDKTAETGGIISEYPPGTAPIATLFPPRNRIISGLSDAVLVIEARKRSGTLITVEMALDQGRDVFALPGRVCDGLSDGCNQLIRQGAEAVWCPEDILEHFFGVNQILERNDSGKEGNPELNSFTPLQNTVINILTERENADVDFIVGRAAQSLGRSVSVREITAVLLQLQMCGTVKETYGGYYDLTVENRHKRG